MRLYWTAVGLCVFVPLLGTVGQSILFFVAVFFGIPVGIALYAKPK